MDLLKQPSPPGALRLIRTNVRRDIRDEAFGKRKLQEAILRMQSVIPSGIL